MTARFTIVASLLALGCLSCPAYAATPLPSSLTATVERLHRELDDRGRTATSRALDAALKPHDAATLPIELLLDVARLQLSLRGLAAATTWARQAQAKLGATKTRGADPRWLASHEALAALLLGETERCMRAMRHCLSLAGPPDACQPDVIARHLVQMAWYAQAKEVMALATDRADVQLRSVIDRAQVASAAGDHELEWRVVKDAMKRWPNEVMLLDAAANALRKLGKHEQAVALLRARFQQAPDTRGILARYEMAFRDLEGAATRRGGPYAEYTKVRRALLERAQAEPIDAPARYVAATLAFDDRRYDEVLAHCEAIRALAPHDARPWGLPALITAWRGDLEAAEKLVQRAEKADPWDAIAPYARSVIARERKDTATAAKHLERYLAMRRDRRTTRFRRKKTRVLGDLHALRRGELPVPWDRPDHPSRRYHLYSLFEPFELPSPPVFIGAIAALLLGLGAGAFWSWKNRS